MRVFVISDTHFGHKNLVKLCGRPHDFSERIVANWNRLVEPEDLVIHLGDYIVWKYSDFLDVMDQMNGRKVLVFGNHDHKSLVWYMEHGFSFACHSFSWNYHGENILFTHEPSSDGGFDINIHGHLHTGMHRTEYTLTDKHILFSLEQRKYEPVLLNSLLEKG